MPLAGLSLVVFRGLLSELWLVYSLLSPSIAFGSVVHSLSVVMPLLASLTSPNIPTIQQNRAK